MLAGRVIIHARIYILADYHGIAALQTLALCKLRRILVQCNLFQDSIGAIVELARYTYRHTPVDRNNGPRSMISMYVACKAEELWETRDFRSLIRTVGDFVVDLVKDMLDGISFKRQFQSRAYVTLGNS